MRSLIVAGIAAALAVGVAAPALAQIAGPIQSDLPQNPGALRPAVMPLGPGALLTAAADGRPIGQRETVVVSLNLPPGAYSLSGKLVASTDNLTASATSCRLVVGAAEADYASITMAERSRASIALSGSVATDLRARTVELRCQTSAVALATARWATLQAVSVQTINGSR